MSPRRHAKVPASSKPFYRASDVDQLAVDCLKAASLFPTAPAPIRAERFVEKHFRLGGVLYEELPPAVLGCTIFEGGKVRSIVVSRSLCEDPSKVAERRLRTTLAHEAGHGLLHAALFRDLHEPSLFDGSDDVQKDRVLCRDGEAGARYNGKWWEAQANMMIGSLLLPKPLVYDVVDPHTVESPLGVRQLEPGIRHAVALELADVFNVNPVVAQIRLDILFPPAKTEQLTL